MPFPLQLRLDEGSAGELRLEARSLENGDTREESVGAGHRCEARSRWRVMLRAGAAGFNGSCSLFASLDTTPVTPPDTAPVTDSADSGTTPWLLFPGYFYGSGRMDESRRTPRLAPLNADRWDSPSWDFSLDRGSYPVLLARQGEHWAGLDWSVELEQSDGPGAHAAVLCAGPGFSVRGENLELRLNIPDNERPRSFTRSRYDAPTTRSICLAPGESLSLTVGWWDFEADAHGYGFVLRTVYEELRPAHEPARAEPAKLLAATAAHGLLAWHWNEPGGYMVYSVPFDRTGESIANARGTILSWHAESLGFAGGFPVAFGLLWHAEQSGDDAARAVAMRLIERYCSEGQTSWGFFRAGYHPGRAVTPNGSFPNPAPAGAANADATGDTPFYGSWWLEDQSLVHARTTADASHYLARCLALLGPAHPRYGEWRAALRRSLLAALEVQARPEEPDEGRFGQHYDVVRRCVALQQGCGGLLWITAMHHAEPLFGDDPEFQAKLGAAMQRAGEAYARDVRAECIYGAPEDVALTPTSEDGYNAVMAYAALHRRCGRTADLELLRRAADWTLSWRRAYNARFHPKSILHGFRTTGGDFASSQNNHLHIYGLCCLRDFYYLAERTGDAWYAARADEHFAFAAQLLCTTAGQWNGQRGMCSEQFYVSDWSVWADWDPTVHHEQKGTLCGFSAVWCVNMILLGLEQRCAAEEAREEK